MPDTDTPLRTRKQIWTVLLLAFAASILVYGAVLFLLVQNRARTPSALPDVPPLLLSLLSPGAVLCLLAAVVWFQVRTRPFFSDRVSSGLESVKLPSFETFQSTTVIALALAEACSLLGFMRVMLGAPVNSYAYYAAGSLFVILGYLLPFGRSCWAVYERQRSTP